MIRCGGLGIFQACVLLALATSAAYVAVGWLAFNRYGPVGWVTVAFAAAACWLPATAALVITALARNSTQQISGMLVANTVRLTVPLLAGLTLQGVSQPLAETGIFGWIVVFYLLTLVIETTLSVLVVRR